MQSEALPRSISYADLDTTKRCREYIGRDYQQLPPEGGTFYFTSTPSFTLVLPALTGYNEGFREFFYRRIVDYNTKNELEAAKCLNYCQDASELNPLYTTGDGNCLLHAASLGMWGFQDRTFILRNAISESVMHCRNNSLKERWYAWRDAELRQIGTVLDARQWENEWQQMIRYTTEARNDHGVMEGLDQFHIFILANVLRRPIILFAIPKIRSVVSGGTLQQLDFHGLYLPLLWDPVNCKKGPLPIAFRNGHYSALTIIDNPMQYRNGFLHIPLFDSNGYDLPVRFTRPPAERAWDCRRAYLDLTDVLYQGRQVQCAKLTISDTLAYLKPLLEGFVLRCHQAYRSRDMGQPPLDQPVVGPCRGGCGRAGGLSSNGYCFACYEANQKKNLQQNSATGSLKCSNNCNNPGRPEYLGMCETCYRQQQQHPHVQKQALPPSLAGNGQEPVSRPCPTAGCDFYGSAETNYYCSSCFKKNLTQIYDQQGPGVGRRPSNPNTSPQLRQPFVQQELVVGSSSSGQKCGVCWQSIGAPEYGGTCRQCYESRANTRQKCLNCRDLFGAPEYNGLCSACFKKQRQQSANPAQNCPHCHNMYGSPEYGGLCSTCFKKQTLPKASSDMCVACREFHASPEYGGDLCHTCFMQKTKSDQGQGRGNQLNGPPWGQTHHFGEPSPQPKLVRSGSVQDRVSALDGRATHPSTAPQGYPAAIREVPRQRQTCVVCDFTLSLDTVPLTICRRHASWVRNTLSVLKVDSPLQMSASPPVPIGVEPENADAYGRPISSEQPPHEAMPRKPQQSNPAAGYTAPALAPYQGTSSSSDRVPITPSSSSATGPSAAGSSAAGFSAAGSSAERKPVKMLCAITGCGYYAESRLNGLCQGCYDEHYGQKGLQAHSTYNNFS